nr:hypothetical protein [Tanacetum cinerariifolium]
MKGIKNFQVGVFIFEFVGKPLNKSFLARSLMVFNLELRDLPYKIDQTANIVIKEAVHIALQAPLRDHFKELPEADMKEILHQQMFENGSYNSLPEHVALYEAFEASMDRANRDEFLAEMDNSPRQQSASHSEQAIKDVPIADNVNVSDSKDIATVHLPKLKTRPDWMKSVPKKDRPATLEPDCVEECHRMLMDQVDLVNPEGHRILPNIRKPLPLGGPPGQVTIQSQFFFNKDMEYLVSGDKGTRLALSISKMKVAHYLDIGLKELYQDLFKIWVCFLKNIVLRRVDYKEYKILEADFKILHLNDFEDLYLLHLQEDYTIVSKPRVLIYRDRNNQKKMMRETEVHKFSDGTLNRILEKLDDMVKDFRLFKYNPGMTTRIWSEDDKRRSKEFMK